MNSMTRRAGAARLAEVMTNPHTPAEGEPSPGRTELPHEIRAFLLEIEATAREYLAEKRSTSVKMRPISQEGSR